MKNFTNTAQFCGGHLLDDDTPQGYVSGIGKILGPKHGKGFLCPAGSFCVEAGNPYNGTQSFDNILQSLELVFVIMSSNTWSSLLYTMADTDYLISSLFFIVGILILSLWLISLLIAVITSSFQIIREESKTSAFTGADILDDDSNQEQEKPRISTLKRFYERTSWVWVVIIAYGLVCQTLRSATMSDFRKGFINASEIIVTLILMGEIIIRFAIDWRHFFKSKRNATDFTIASITTIIQISTIKHAYGGRMYAWLTIFQIIRVYRVVLAISTTRELIVSLVYFLRMISLSHTKHQTDDRIRKRHRSAEPHPLRVSDDLPGFHLRFTPPPR